MLSTVDNGLVVRGSSFCEIKGANGLIAAIDSDDIRQKTPQDVIDSFPKYSIRKDGAYTDIVCPICFRQYDTGDRVICLPCKHNFHSYCIENWLKWVRSACPVDRKSIVRSHLSNNFNNDAHVLVKDLPIVEGTASEESSSSDDSESSSSDDEEYNAPVGPIQSRKTKFEELEYYKDRSYGLEKGKNTSGMIPETTLNKKMGQFSLFSYTNRDHAGKIPDRDQSHYPHFQKGGEPLVSIKSKPTQANQLFKCPELVERRKEPMNRNLFHFQVNKSKTDFSVNTSGKINCENVKTREKFVKQNPRRLNLSMSSKKMDGWIYKRGLDEAISKKTIERKT